MKRVIVYLSLAVLVMSGCQAVNERVLVETPHGDGAEVLNAFVPENGLLSYISIKVNEEFAAELEAATGEDGFVDVAKVKSIPDAGIVRMRRLFMHGGKFEPRMRKYDLHRWYKIDYDETHSITKAGAGLNIPGVEIIELNPRDIIVGNPRLVSYVQMDKTTSTSNAPFDDPLFEKQWDFYNDGTASSAVSGCDVNVVPVWKKYKTGSADVIVSVVDQGIDFNHEDLADNMWLNPEKKGDNRYGYNFVTNSYTITPGDHGTHVAGTIAAVNNNGKGICGIAGGDSKKKVSGVKLMSCQKFVGKESGSGPEAIVWGCNHGAVISQNSWGSLYPGTTSDALKVAVDYFTENAGFDEKGIQTGPMAGGIVVFAAGNDYGTVPYGIDYERMYIVASLGPDYRLADYSNHGPWVHISAPGGNGRKGCQITSTVVGNKYGLMEGTSMACPHVSGVAALIIANRAAKGFTSAELRNLMNKSAVSIEAFNKGAGTGAGLVNAYGSIAGSGGKAPEKPTGLTLSSQSNNVTCTVTVPKDEDDGTPSSIYVYYSTSDFTKVDDASFAMFYVDNDAKVGSTLQGTIGGLEFNTKYYMAAQAADLAGNRSALTARVQVTTGSNSAPQLNSLGAVSATIKPHEKASMDFSITEPDGHFYTIELKQGSTGTKLDTLVRDLPKVVLTGADAASGSYQDTLVVTDYYGLSVQQIVSYTILENHKPYIGNKFEDVPFSSNTAAMITFNAKDYFKDDDGEDLSYVITLGNTMVCNMTYASGTFHLTPLNYGNVDVTVEGTDVRGEKVSQSFRVLVRDGSRSMDLYPNPVSDVLNIRTGEKGTWHVRIISQTGAVFYEADREIGPFDPASIDMKDAFPGVFTIFLTRDGKEEKYSIVKI